MLGNGISFAPSSVTKFIGAFGTLDQIVYKLTDVKPGLRRAIALVAECDSLISG